MISQELTFYWHCLILIPLPSLVPHHHYYCSILWTIPLSCVINHNQTWLFLAFLSPCLTPTLNAIVIQINSCNSIIIDVYIVGSDCLTFVMVVLSHECNIMEHSSNGVLFAFSSHHFEIWRTTPYGQNLLTTLTTQHNSISGFSQLSFVVPSQFFKQICMSRWVIHLTF